MINNRKFQQTKLCRAGWVYEILLFKKKTTKILVCVQLWKSRDNWLHFVVSLHFAVSKINAECNQNVTGCILRRGYISRLYTLFWL